ncbi:MAG: cation:proton antiporter [Betaproteobacteria bacterium]|jgi:Kef-type K+ transport system membrane component KefB|nr:cation:proton antiporter [Burkholderiaceae bacterium]MCZ8112101.1 cation:proton antiporter [Rubrivivax sp.]MCZ8175721.1 cation:proton antiporter [Burkholderiaceae bacterium]
MVTPALTTVELFLIAMAVIFFVPYALWRLGRTDYWAPLVVVQIVTGILLGPGLFGAAFPELYAAVFKPAVVQSLNGLAWWAVSLFVFIAGLELDLKSAWTHRVESAITAGCALLAPLLLGSLLAAGLLALTGTGWLGPRAEPWQFVAGIGMGCAVTALPILVLLMEKMDILRQPLGQRILRYASLDDILIWTVLALILLDWTRLGRQAVFVVVFALSAWAFRRLLVRVPQGDRWFLMLPWLALVSLGADWCGLHFMVGAFLAGAVLERDWFPLPQLDALRANVLLVMMPVFFLSTGLRTEWGVGGVAVFAVTAALVAASVGGKLLGVAIAGRLQSWAPGEARTVGWLLQTKGLIEIIFANILLDRQIISADTFTALLLMAVVSTMLTVPMVAPRLARQRDVIAKSG